MFSIVDFIKINLPLNMLSVKFLSINIFLKHKKAEICKTNTKQKTRKSVPCFIGAIEGTRTPMVAH